MKLWSNRKTDEEYVEQVRKEFKQKWPLARLFLLVYGLVCCGIFAWYTWILLHIGDSLIWADADYLLKMKISMAFILGTVAGMMFMPTIGCLFWGVFWSWRQGRDIRLMLEYHDALVAHGVSPDEIGMQEKSLAKAWDDEEDAVYDEI